MTKGAVHPNGTNFRRVARLDVVARVRRLCETKLLAERPDWLEWCERVPPLENHNLKLQARTVRNPYRQMVQHVLKKYPDLRFQDCYVDGNDWSKGNDAYRDDHPAMQFVARQLDFMRQEGLTKQAAFSKTEELFRERREHLEREQKVLMAMAVERGVMPMFATGSAYLQMEKAKAEAAHLNVIKRRLQQERMKAEERQAREQEQALSEEELARIAEKRLAAGELGEGDPPDRRQQRNLEKEQLARDMARSRSSGQGRLQALFKEAEPAPEAPPEKPREEPAAEQESSREQDEAREVRAPAPADRPQADPAPPSTAPPAAFDDGVVSTPKQRAIKSEEGAKQLLGESAPADDDDQDDFGLKQRKSNRELTKKDKRGEDGGDDELDPLKTA